jgi:flavin reductase (DIM6/NTAB) family NADH-FMN oxidoreductase RutF
MNGGDANEIGPALGRLASGLFILTARQGGRETGLLVSWVQQCGFEPPQVTACVRKGRDVLAWLGDGAAFTLNVLGAGQKKLVGHFAKGFSLDEDAFTGQSVERPEGEGPVLDEALAHLRCRVAARFDGGGDHVVLVGTVVGGRLHRDGGEPYVHLRRNGLGY